MSTIEEHDKEQNACIDIDDAGRTDYDNEPVTRSAPRWAWNVIDETLALDMSSVAFDRETRQSVENAVQAMIDACESRICLSEESLMALVNALSPDYEAP